MRKRLLVAMMCGVFACCLALAGCGGGGSDEPAPEEESGTAVEEPAAPEEEPMAGMPNPWSDVATAEEAAAGAGIDSFNVITEGQIQGMDMVSAPVFRCMEGIAEVDYEFGASSICVRKGLASAAEVEPGDISGVYGDYPEYWTIDVDGVTVNCLGNVAGQAIKVVWTNGDYAYSIYTQGLGGDEDFGLDSEAVMGIASTLMS